jgi:hypothetical protein
MRCHGPKAIIDFRTQGRVTIRHESGDADDLAMLSGAQMEYPGIEVHRQCALNPWLFLRPEHRSAQRPSVFG